MNERPIRPLVSCADQSGPFGVWDNLRQSNFWGQICDSVPLVFTEELVARAASPDVYRSYDVTLMDEVYDAIIDNVVLMSLQESILTGKLVLG